LAQEDRECEGGGDPKASGSDGGAVGIASKALLVQSVDELDGEQQQKGEVKAGPVA
jgi:hypothetical protein